MITQQRIIDDYKLCMDFLTFIEQYGDIEEREYEDVINDYFNSKDYTVQFKTSDGKITRPLNCKIKKPI